MPVLTEDMKVTIVQALACYDTPTQVAKLIKEQYGVEITRQAVHHYDPSKKAGVRMGKKLRDLFEVTRTHFLAEISAIPIANQSYRLKVLQQHLDRLDERGNSVGVAMILKQAAEEVGGAYTNRRELTGKNGGPIEQKHTNVTPEQLDAAVRRVRDEF